MSNANIKRPYHRCHPAATEVIVVMVVIETRAAIEDSEVIIIDITEIIAGVLSTIHKNGPT